MTKEELYMSLPYDLSGSMSKNRFRLELLWGISKMFDIYDAEDFCVVFDLVCDIEIHFADSLEFYQIKTHKIQSPYDFNTISKIGKGSQNSILGKLYVLKREDQEETNVKVALVSNAYLKIGSKIKSDVETISFDDLDKESKDKIKNTLSKEFHKDIKDINLKNFNYIYTSMNLLEPGIDVNGKITRCFENIKNCEPKKPNALCRLIIETAKEKACYELNSTDYHERLQRKGITKAQLDEMLNKYIDNTDVGVEATNKYIENLQDIKQRKKLKKALVKVFESSYSSNELKDKEKEISRYINTNINKLPDDFEEIVDKLLEKFSKSFSLEYDKEEVYIYMVLILKRWEEGIYE